MIKKSKCKSPNVWINGKRKPFKRGYCKKSKTTTSASRRRNCKSPRVWVPANRKTGAKGKCVTVSSKKLQSPKGISPKSKIVTSIKSKSIKLKVPKGISPKSKRVKSIKRRSSSIKRKITSPKRHKSFSPK